MFGATSSRPRMAFDHTLCGEKALDFVAHLRYVPTLAKPFWTFCTKPETLQTETDTCLAVSVLVLLFVAFLSADSARVAARLGADGAFCLRRPGLL